MVITEHKSSEMYAQSLICLIISKTAKLVKKCTELKMCVFISLHKFVQNIFQSDKV
jgi:hypothetical protein